MTTTLALTRLSGHFAARIDTPFDELLDEASHQALRDALVDHKVLMLPGADPSIEQHIHGIAHLFTQFNQRLFADLERLVERNAALSYFDTQPHRRVIEMITA